MSVNQIYLDSYDDFKHHVVKLFLRLGFEITDPKTRKAQYDFCVSKNNVLAAVQVKWLKNNVTKPQINTFAGFLSSAQGRQFKYGLLITSKGFSGPARALITSWGKDSRIFCGVARQNKFLWLHKDAQAPVRSEKKIYLGVFTSKGGVGKTTVAAHLAGAFALQGINVALIDIDPAQNLKKLIGDGVAVPRFSNDEAALSRIDVFNFAEWHEDAAQDVKMVVCDCSPVMDHNPEELVKRFDICLIPVTLNPIGLNKHGNVIEETLKDIRRKNESAYSFVFINNFKRTTEKRFNLLRDLYLATFDRLREEDGKFHCIDPSEVKIRESDLLFYWGTHLLENENLPKSELAFKLVGGKCYPRDDFINLTEYIEVISKMDDDIIG
jgi:cellulose biosynthesis protein BcsQ